VGVLVKSSVRKALSRNRGKGSLLVRLVVRTSHGAKVTRYVTVQLRA
jgi:hypothetical protein